METNKNIQDKVDSAFSALDAIEPVNVSPFFKDKTMQVLFAEKEEKQSVWSWFTPKLQLATLVCIVVLNVVAFSKMETASSYDENLSEFAESYGLVASDNDTLILN
ncbi:hypothetical protein FPF71_15715 [Algibacter amylolyticus]|uniref:Uncharacterized protein n=1 Tax=Algibacter amylolyticus TaxID=1608400 RepID=A0A5M7AXJ6_9FLAO|nr:hypothetical protein [Algibacter amylolyticus]KAA5821952.1 hypothetical protein F2B50_15715 [Algibacter amylolyticus]MBB5269248.1 hypothetical protein [Algibacter amylolyticus]TSJ73236.1 hypothetical protein FPF71_15715 [Algibacter amylolyticus]